MSFALYLESGPRRRKTMVHVLNLLGCIAQGPTTEAALESTPEAIRAYLRFLRRHGEAVDPEEALTTVVVEHVTDGVWLGYGDPTPGFSSDFEPLSAEDLSVNLRRLGWLQSDLVALARALPRANMTAEPEGGGRSIYHILQHMASSHGVYLRYAVGKVEELSEAVRTVERDPDPDDIPAALARVWQIAERVRRP